jgi:hypothetical protein
VTQNPSVIARLVENTAATYCTSTLCTFVDDGRGTVADSTIVPFVPNSLGSWMAIPDLTTARAWGGLAESAPSSVTGNTHYLYAFGGIPATNTPASALRSYEMTTITITPANNKAREAHAVSAWTVGTSQMQNARYNIPATTMDPSVAPNLDLGTGTFYIHVGPGNTADQSVSETMEVAIVPANGILTLLPVAGVSSGPLQGPCMFPYTSSEGEMGFLGGRSSPPGVAGKMDSTACTGVNCLTDFGPSWNAGWGLTGAPVPFNTKCTKVKPFVYLAGGNGATGGAVNFTLFNYV